MASSVYTTIEEKGFYNGKAFIMTPNASVIEAHILKGIIIFCKSLRLSCEQICDVLSNGDIKDITFQKADISADVAQPQVFIQTIAGALSACAMNPSQSILPRVLCIFQLLANLIKREKADGIKAFDLISRQISQHHQGFLPDVSTLSDRIGQASENFGISTATFINKLLPADMSSVPEWVLGNFGPLADNVMKDVFLYHVLFGETLRKVIKTNAETDASLGAKKGYAGMSKSAYPELQIYRSANIFRGLEKLGDMPLRWHTDKKRTALFTKIDMDKFGLTNDEMINLIFEK